MTSTLDTNEAPYSPEAGTADSDRHAKIQGRAYELYGERGGQSGAELDDWLPRQFSTGHSLEVAEEKPHSVWHSEFRISTQNLLVRP